MRKVIVLVAVIGAFAIRISGQTQVQKLPLLITSDYYAEPNVLVLHAHNNSGKDIVGYAIIIRHRDGTSAAATDMLNMLIDTEMAKDPNASEGIRQKSIGYEAVNAAGNGIFVAGTTHDLTLNGMNSASESDITAGVVFYADGSFDKQDENTFKHMLAARQSQLLAMKKVNETIKGALAEPTSEHPATAAITELAKSTAEAMAHKVDAPYDTEHLQIVHLQNEIQNLRGIQQPQKGTTERERLMQYVEEQDKRIELMTPHCHLEIDLKK